MASKKIVAKIAGNLFAPDRLFGKPEAEKDMLLGTLIGICTGIHEKHNNITDETHQGFTGNFEYMDADPERVGYQSGILYLPSGINEMLMDAVKAADGGQVRFAFEVYAERSENARKRAWSFRDLAPPSVEDPMAELRQYLPGADKPAAITDASSADKAGGNPSGAKGGGKL